MLYQKGQSGNPSGRPKGTLNKNTESIRGTISDFVKRNLQTIQTDFDSLEPVQRLLFIERILKYAISPLASVDLNTVVKHEISALPDDQLQILAEKVLSLETNLSQ